MENVFRRDLLGVTFQCNGTNTAHVDNRISNCRRSIYGLFGSGMFVFGIGFVCVILVLFLSIFYYFIVFIVLYILYCSSPLVGGANKNIIIKNRGRCGIPHHKVNHEALPSTLTCP